MRKVFLTLAFLVPSLACANEIPRGYQTPFTQIAGLGWAMSPRSGIVGTPAPPTSQLEAYPNASCATPPSAPDSYTTSKDWYFDVANGHPPAFYANLGVPQAQWGDTNHPFDNPSAIWGTPDLPGWGSNTYPTATNSLHILALYGYYRNTSNIIFNDGENFTTNTIDYGNPTTYDPNHFRLWPGDTVWLRGDASGDAWGQFSTNGGNAGDNNKNVDGSGNTKWVWILRDPSFPEPIFYSPSSLSILTLNNSVGFILQGVGVQASMDYTALTSAGLSTLTFPLGSGGPSGFANNAVSRVPLTGGSGTGAQATLTFNSSGQLQSFSLSKGGTGYKAGDVLGVAANSGVATANAPNGIGSYTGFSITVIAPNTTIAANLIGMNSVEVPNTNLVSTTSFAGTTITLNTDLLGTTKVFTFGGGANPIPFPGTQSYLLDALLNATYTLSHDPAISPLYNITTFNSSYNTTWSTLTSITTPPSNGNTFTFGWDNSTWTWVTSGATGHQINIPGTNTLTNAINAAQAALTAAYGTSLTLTSVTSGATGVSWTAKTTANQAVWGPAVPPSAAPDLPSNGSTFIYNGVSSADVWTFVTGTPTGHQVKIGASVGDTILNIQSALASAYPGTIVAQPNMFNGGITFNAVTPGLDGILLMASNYPYQGANVDGTKPSPFLSMDNTNTGIILSGGSKGLFGSTGSTFVNQNLSVSQPISTVGSVDFTAGNTFTFNSVTYTWGTTGTNPVPLGGNVDLSLQNAAAVIDGTGAGGTSNPGYQAIFKGSVIGGEHNDTKDFIMDSLDIGAWGLGHTFGAYTPDYPSNKSLGFSTITGAHSGPLAWPHSYWNIIDWLDTPFKGAINITGDRDPANAGQQPIIGTSCITLSNTYMHHIPTLGIVQAIYVLVNNFYSNYNADGDTIDNYVSHDILYNNVWAVNPLNPLHGIHPDGVQFGAGGAFSLAQINFLWSNVSILNSHFIGGTDPMLADPINFPDLYTTGWDNVVYPIIDQQTGLNDTGDRLNNIQVKGNVFYTDNINVFLPWAQNSVIANNTVLNHGSSPATSNGGITLGGFLNQVPVTANNVVVNNLSVGFGYSDSSADVCADTSNTILNNYVVTPWVNGNFAGSLASGAGEYECARTVPPDRSPAQGYAATDQGAHVITVSTNPTDGQTISINSITYTWKNTPVGATQIQIGGTLAQSLANGQTTAQANDSTIWVNPNTTSGTSISWGVRNQQYETTVNGTGVKFFGRNSDINALVTVFAPPSNEIANLFNLNPAPPGYPSSPAGPLVCGGTNFGGYAPAKNIDGNTWAGGAGCVGIGAY